MVGRFKLRSFILNFKFNSGVDVEQLTLTDYDKLT